MKRGEYFEYSASIAQERNDCYNLGVENVEECLDLRCVSEVEPSNFIDGVRERKIKDASWVLDLSNWASDSFDYD